MGRDEAPGALPSFGLTGSLPRGLHLVESLAYEASLLREPGDQGWVGPGMCVWGGLKCEAQQDGKAAFSCPSFPTMRRGTLQSGPPCPPQARCFIESGMSSGSEPRLAHDSIVGGRKRQVVTGGKTSGLPQALAAGRWLEDPLF